MPDLVRVTTAGSVDDGKSTLVGRLLHDSRSLLDDQLATVERISRERGDDHADLALLTDGLRAEREQGITIDVAYRSFSTPERRFLLADAPGHVQYTRNAVTAASTADVALILVDARRGVTEQTRRHAFLASLLGVPHLVLVVNKMDLVGWSRDVFEAVRQEFADFAARLRVHDLAFIPVSALHGDGVVERGEHLGWYDGGTLLGHLERLHVASDRNLVDVRFPVQTVIRPQPGGAASRGLAGTVASGVLRPGDRVAVLPSGFETTVAAIEGPEGRVEEAFPPMAVVVRLADELDVGRGDLVCRPGNAPTVTQDLDAQVCWLDAGSSLTEGRVYALKHTTRWVRAKAVEVAYRLDVNTLHRDPGASALAMNEIGRVRLRTTSPLFVDPYQENRTTGSFILVDEATNRTVGAGLLTGSHGT